MADRQSGPSGFWEILEGACPGTGGEATEPHTLGVLFFPCLPARGSILSAFLLKDGGCLLLACLLTAWGSCSVW